MEKEKGKDKAEAKRRLDWHSGFEGGLQLSFRKYRGELTIEREHPLSEEPLRIDLRDTEKITEMLNSGKTPEAIADFCKYPLKQVMSVYKSLKKA